MPTAWAWRDSALKASGRILSLARVMKASKIGDERPVAPVGHRPPEIDRSDRPVT